VYESNTSLWLGLLKRRMSPRTRDVRQVVVTHTSVKQPRFSIAPVLPMRKVRGNNLPKSVPFWPNAAWRKRVTP